MVPELTLTPCFVCGKPLERVDGDLEMQPHGGIMCSTRGNYGSRVFDSMHTKLRFLICDECFDARRDRAKKIVPAPLQRPTYADWDPLD